MKIVLKIMGFLLLFLAGAFLIFEGYTRFPDWWKNVQQKTESELILYGNVDDRQANLTFLVPERVAEILVEEGTSVKQGELLATLETTRIEQDLQAAQAQRDAAKASLEKAENGFRPEERAMAEAGLELARAKINFRKNEYLRMKKLLEKEAVSELEYESAEAEYKFILAEEKVAQANCERIQNGSRPEEIEIAKANLAAAEAQCTILEQRLKDTKLYAPCDGIVRNRVLEPGEMTSPQNTALILAVTSPKWIRIYLPETLLTLVKQGAAVTVHFDGDAKDWEGWIGFISPNAEFTPKNIETPELRTSLVYEARVYIQDPEGVVKLGAPATVRLK